MPKKRKKAAGGMKNGYIWQIFMIATIIDDGP
jgi:hypothetical protein